MTIDDLRSGDVLLFSPEEGSWISEAIVLLTGCSREVSRLGESTKLPYAVKPAVVRVSDTVAMGVLHALADRGLRAGQDIAVVGFDDSIAAQVVPPGLTSVRQPLEQVAREIVNLLGKRLSHTPIEEPGRLLVPTLSVRASS